jgi:hypothetical protein
MKFKQVLNREIVISASHNEGFVVKVGCCTLAYGCADDLLRDLKDYLENSESIDKEYNAAGMNAPQMAGRPTCEEREQMPDEETRDEPARLRNPIRR